MKAMWMLLFLLLPLLALAYIGWHVWCLLPLSAVTKCAPTVGPKDGSFTLQYKSATAIGKAEIVTDREEKIAGLRAICQRFLPHHMDAFDEAIARSLERTAVVKIILIEPPVGKRKQYDKEGEEMKWGRME